MRHPFTSIIFPDASPMDEVTYLELGETPERIELFDGCLYIAPNPGTRHQLARAKLLFALRAANSRAMQSLGSVNLRLGPNRIANPDFVITVVPDWDALVVDADAVRLVGEIVTPTSAALDTVLRPHLYAAAGIPWFLQFDLEARTLRLNRLAGAAYVEHAVAEPGDVLQLTDPVAADIDPGELLPSG